ncbi:collagen alpha-2(I) chain-like [Oncorhynchus nerka]|uniref:collagen alpha-2(I) chain-like n=1 Tax=Oncorhynchus nerka TaxID=8023 RepID=UPI0031B87169
MVSSIVMLEGHVRRSLQEGYPMRVEDVFPEKLMSIRLVADLAPESNEESAQKRPSSRELALIESAGNRVSDSALNQNECLPRIATRAKHLVTVVHLGRHGTLWAATGRSGPPRDALGRHGSRYGWDIPPSQTLWAATGVATAGTSHPAKRSGPPRESLRLGHPTQPNALGRHGSLYGWDIPPSQTLWAATGVSTAGTSHPAKRSGPPRESLRLGHPTRPNALGRHGSRYGWDIPPSQTLWAATGVATAGTSHPAKRSGPPRESLRLGHPTQPNALGRHGSLYGWDIPPSQTLWATTGVATAGTSHPAKRSGPPRESLRLGHPPPKRSGPPRESLRLGHPTQPNALGRHGSRYGWDIPPSQTLWATTGVSTAGTSHPAKRSGPPRESLRLGHPTRPNALGRHGSRYGWDIPPGQTLWAATGVATAGTSHPAKRSGPPRESLRLGHPTQPNALGRHGSRYGWDIPPGQTLWAATGSRYGWDIPPGQTLWAATGVATAGTSHPAKRSGPPRESLRLGHPTQPNALGRHGSRYGWDIPPSQTLWAATGVATAGTSHPPNALGRHGSRYGWDIPPGQTLWAATGVATAGTSHPAKRSGPPRESLRLGHPTRPNALGRHGSRYGWDIPPGQTLWAATGVATAGTSHPAKRSGPPRESLRLGHPTQPNALGHHGSRYGWDIPPSQTLWAATGVATAGTSHPAKRSGPPRESLRLGHPTRQTLWAATGVATAGTSHPAKRSGPPRESLRLGHPTRPNALGRHGSRYGWDIPPSQTLWAKRSAGTSHPAKRSGPPRESLRLGHPTRPNALGHHGSRYGWDIPPSQTLWAATGVATAGTSHPAKRSGPPRESLRLGHPTQPNALGRHGSRYGWDIPPSQTLWAATGVATAGTSHPAKRSGPPRESLRLGHPTQPNALGQSCVVS